MNQTRIVLGLDIGTARIGVAIADDRMRIPVPQGVIEVDGHEMDALRTLITEQAISTVVVGYPRNQSGEATEQTKLVESVVEPLKSYVDVQFQDESLTSVLAEKRLKARNKPYSKGDIDAEVAVIILEDYLETH